MTRRLLRFGPRTRLVSGQGGRAPERRDDPLMNTQIGLEKCAPFIWSHLQDRDEPPPLLRSRGSRPAVTISRQCGSGGHSIAQQLAADLQARLPQGEPAWRVLDRNLIEQVLADHDLPHRLARFMPEDRISELADLIDELLGIRPSSWTLVEQIAATILRLATEGNVILVGRAANVITWNLEHVFHVRLVGSLARRCQHIQEIHGLGKPAALRFIRQEDRGRKRYLKKHFGKEAEEGLFYHLVINTDRVPYDTAARLIADQVSTRFPASCAERAQSA